MLAPFAHHSPENGLACQAPAPPPLPLAGRSETKSGFEFHCSSDKTYQTPVVLQWNRNQRGYPDLRRPSGITLITLVTKVVEAHWLLQKHVERLGKRATPYLLAQWRGNLVRVSSCQFVNDQDSDSLNPSHS